MYRPSQQVDINYCCGALLLKGCVFCQGAGSLSYNAVTGSSVQRLATVAADHFIKVLDIEGEKISVINFLKFMDRQRIS
jgi:hypothetical protein